MAERRAKPSHGQDGRQEVGREIHGRSRTRQGEGRQHTEQVASAGRAVQQSDKEGRPLVGGMRRRRIVAVHRRVHMHVRMGVGSIVGRIVGRIVRRIVQDVVDVVVGVDDHTAGAMQGPGAESDQHKTDGLSQMRNPETLVSLDDRCRKNWAHSP